MSEMCCGLPRSPHERLVRLRQRHSPTMSSSPKSLSRTPEGCDCTCSLDERISRASRLTKLRPALLLKNAVYGRSEETSPATLQPASPELTTELHASYRSGGLVFGADRSDAPFDENTAARALLVGNCEGVCHSQFCSQRGVSASCSNDVTMRKPLPSREEVPPQAQTSPETYSWYFMRHTAMSSRERPGFITRTPWVFTVFALLLPAAVCWLAGLPYSCCIFLAAVVRIGPLRRLISLLPEVRNANDFEDRRYRVRQSIGMASICCGIYALIPDELRPRP